MGFTTRIKKRGIMAKTISQAGNPKTKLWWTSAVFHQVWLKSYAIVQQELSTATVITTQLDL